MTRRPSSSSSAAVRSSGTTASAGRTADGLIGDDEMQIRVYAGVVELEP